MSEFASGEISLMDIVLVLRYTKLSLMTAIDKV